MKDIGRQLKAKREELGLTVEQVQAETKIRRKYLEALETGAVEVIPGEVYVKGFLRFYANFLGLDGLGLVRDYGARKEAGTEEADSPNGPVRAPARSAGRSTHPAGPPLKATRAARDGRLGRFLIYALVIVLLVAAGGVYYAWSHAWIVVGGETGADGGPPPAGGGATPGGSGGGGAGDGGTGSGSDGSGDGISPGDASGDLPGDGGADGQGDTPDGTSSPPWAVVAESDARVDYVVYGVPFSVSLEVVAETCWVRIQTDGRTVLERTLVAGERTEWTASESLVMLLGRPHLVVIGVDGQPLGAAGAEDRPRTLTFEVNHPPVGGEDAGGT